ncbi:36531_t:CDS:2, partial [Gigaspora margarita]
VKHLLTIPQLPLININNEIVSNIFHPNQATTALQQIALNNASKLELSNLELQELEHKLANYQAFSTFQPSSDLYYIKTILKELIPIPIIQFIQSFNISYKIASTAII